MMQSLIDEAESGKYNNKKTLSDRIQDVVQQRKLTSYMNNTKWREMLDDFIEIPQLSIMYKTLFDEINPEFFWSVIDDEYLGHMNMAVIEWFKIEDVIREYRIIFILNMKRILASLLFMVTDRMVDYQ